MWGLWEVISLEHVAFMNWSLLLVAAYLARPLGLMMLQDVKAALEILGLTAHGCNIFSKDMHIQYLWVESVCVLGRGERLFHYMSK